MSAPQIAVCMPTTAGRAVSIYWALHLRLLALPNLSRFLIRSDYRVDSNREGLAESALAIPGITHLLWWDDDIWPARNGLASLLRHRYPVVSGVYRDKQGRSTVMRFANADRTRIDRLEPPKPGTRLYAEATGLGWCLVDVRLLRRLPRPWFRFENTMGEDCYFFRRLIETWRIPVLVDGDAACGHEMPTRLRADNVTEPIWAGLGGPLEVTPT